MLNRLRSASVRRSAIAIVVVIVAFLTSSCTGGGGSSDGAGTVMETHEGRGYKVSYPKDWTTPGRGKLIAGSDFEVVDLPKGARIPDASLDVLTSPATTSLRRASEDLAVLSRSATDYKLLEKKQTALSGGEVAFRVVQTYSSRSAGKTVRLRQSDLLTATRDDEQIDVRVVCRLDRCDSYGDRLTRILRSVELT